jgi:hypothetical protein
MPFASSASVFAYLITTVCAIALMRRSSNRLIRFLSFSIGLPPLCQTVIILGSHGMWITPVIGHAAELLELPASALSLAALYLLNKENSDRRNTDSRLRVAEASPAPIALSREQEESAEKV